MTGQQALFGALAVVALAVALLSAWRLRRRARRDRPDAVGWVDWYAVQMAALLALLVSLGMMVRR